MDYKPVAAIVFLLLGLGCCQNDPQLEVPPGKVGGEVVFKLKSPLSKPPTQISWEFNTTRIITKVGAAEDIHPDYRDRVSVDGNTAALTLRNLMVNDTGEYSVALSIDGVPSSGKTSLEVYEPITVPPITSTEGPLIAKNSSVNLTCDAEGTIITREWMKDGRPLLTNERIDLLEDNRTLSISPVMKGDNGRYRCTVGNPVGPNSQEYDLVVNYGPENVSISGDSNVNEGDDVTLRCIADSLPTASFTWMFNHTQIASTAEYPIKAVKQSNAGTYTCSAWNSITDQKNYAEHELKVTPQDEPTRLSGGAIAGIVIGSLGGACLVGGALGFGLKKAGLF